MRRLICSAIAPLLAAALAGGCGKTDNTKELVAEKNKSNIQRLSNMYAAHQNFKNGTGPKDEAAFKKFVQEFDKNKLDMMGIDPDNLEAVFKSERDGKPFKIRYGVGGGRGSRDAVIFEAEGVAGVRQVGFTNSTVEDVDATRYQELWSGKGGTPVASPSGKDAGRPTGAPTGAPTGPGR